MTSYYVELTFELGKPDDADVFDAHVDDVAEGFANLTGDLADVDGDVGSDLETGRVDLCMTLTSESYVEAMTKAVAAARTAIHAAGGSTRGWEKMLSKMLANEDYRMKARPSAMANDSALA